MLQKPNRDPPRSTPLRDKKLVIVTNDKNYLYDAQLIRGLDKLAGRFRRSPPGYPPLSAPQRESSAIVAEDNKSPVLLTDTMVDPAITLIAPRLPGEPSMSVIEIFRQLRRPLAVPHGGRWRLALPIIWPTSVWAPVLWCQKNFDSFRDAAERAVLLNPMDSNSGSGGNSEPEVGFRELIGFVSVEGPPSSHLRSEGKVPGSLSIRVTYEMNETRILPSLCPVLGYGT